MSKKNVETGRKIKETDRKNVEKGRVNVETGRTLMRKPVEEKNVETGS